MICWEGFYENYSMFHRYMWYVPLHFVNFTRFSCISLCFWSHIFFTTLLIRSFEKIKPIKFWHARYMSFDGYGVFAFCTCSVLVELRLVTNKLMCNNSVWQDRAFTCMRNLYMYDATTLNLSSVSNSGLVPSQWETSLPSNAISHWLGANLEATLQLMGNFEC